MESRALNIATGKYVEVIIGFDIKELYPWFM